LISDFAVIGLGAIGSSLMRALHESGANVQGFDPDSATVSYALREGFQAQLWNSDLRVSAQTVALCVPVRASTEVLATLARRCDYTLITDVGSTKRFVNAAAESAGLARCFVGAHPLAGTEQTGWPAGSSTMFRGKTVFLCPTSQTETPALNAARTLWQRLGAEVQQLTAEEHDERVAWISHLPQLSATALALALRTGQVARSELGRGGIDMTRLAASDARLWRDILATNADNLDEPLGCLIEALTDMRVSLRTKSEDRLSRLIETARGWSA
jgi:prephenate dehydrogenase